MRILSIETSCDETAVSIIEATGNMSSTETPKFTVLSNLVLSQISLHEKYGGVFPNLAKREHSKNLGPLIEKALEEAGLLVRAEQIQGEPATYDTESLRADLVREPELAEALATIFSRYDRPGIDLITVTYGPGLEPALWVGINAAKTLSKVWNIPLLPMNHMEGHISSVFLESTKPVQFPAIALLISGGHTELVLMKDWLAYEIIGETRDDAVGEAFDKVARMLGLPYPGGPKISQMALEAREEKKTNMQGDFFEFPRPMRNSHDLNFSFSGLKTSVLYKLKELPEIDLPTKKRVAMAFEDAVIDVLVHKTHTALETYGACTLIIAGGVIANKTLRTAFESLVSKFPDTTLLVPTHVLSTDNALMIALAAYIRDIKTEGRSRKPLDEIKAEGNVRLA